MKIAISIREKEKPKGQESPYFKAMVAAGIRSELPILGISRGAQLINVRLGGTLYQDLKSDTAIELDHRQQGSCSATTHSVIVIGPDSLLHELVSANCPVNSLHHQAIRRLGIGLKVTAHSEAEEMVAEHPEQLMIFAQFVAKCRERAAAKTKALP